MKMKTAKVLTVGAIIGLGSIGSPAIAAPADTASTQAVSTDVSAPSMTYYKLNEAQLGLSSDAYTFDVAESGVATATNDATGVSEALPKQASDALGKAVTLKYEKTAAGELIVSTIDPSASSSASEDGMVGTADFNGAQCALGTVGGAGAGGLAGGLGGAAVGTVTLPVVGTVGAGAVGLIGGGIFGGMTGAAASCFG